MIYRCVYVYIKYDHMEELNFSETERKQSLLPSRKYLHVHELVFLYDGSQIPITEECNQLGLVARTLRRMNGWI